MVATVLMLSLVNYLNLPAVELKHLLMFCQPDNQQINQAVSHSVNQSASLLASQPFNL